MPISLFSTSYCCSIPNMVKNSYLRISTKQQRLPFCCQCCLVPRRILLFYHHSCQKDRVPTGYKAYFISGCSNNILFLYLLKTTRSRGKMFSFSIIFGITFYLSLIISRLCELKLLKYFRSKGRNSRTVVFVGNNPAVSEMYKTMTEDPRQVI